MLTKFKNCIFKIFIELFIFDKKKRSIVKARHAKKYLKEYVDKAVQSDIEKKDFDSPKIIWQYWHQGEENAPELIKKCFESVNKFMPDYKQVILSFDTIKDYIDLPQRYYDLLAKGKIQIAHFSDILRVYLLEQYGGTWIDSTMYLTDKLPDDIMNSNFFVFQKDMRTDNQENNMSCFFIHSKAYSVHVSMFKRILDNYWKENDFAINYFMFEHISTMLAGKTPYLKAEWDAMPYYSAENTGVMQKELFEDYTVERWNELKSLTNLHKLSYKILREETSAKSFYDYIINN